MPADRANAFATICRPVDRRKQGRPDRRVREFRVTGSEVEQHCGQGGARVPQHLAVACRHRGRASSRARDPIPRRASRRGTRRPASGGHRRTGTPSRSGTAPAVPAGSPVRAWRASRSPVASSRRPAHRAGAIVAGRDELGRVVAQAGDRERTRPDRAGGRTVGRAAGPPGCRQGCGPGRSAGWPPGGSHRAGSSA